jgi:uncharacterized protein (TIGR00297 family)
VTWLTRGGVVAAALVGVAVTWGIGWRGLLLLLAFFISSSILTRLASGAGGRRNARQVLANGGVAAAAALAGRWGMVAGALAAATADTWATEIGAFSPWLPRLLTNGSRVPAGSSGGITALGTAGGLVGAGAIAALAWLIHPRPAGPGPAVVIAIAGITGMLVDSLLGATVQGLFECPQCAARSERPGLVCHEPVRLIRGWRWLDNDAVNLAATLAGAAVGALA